jgi:cytochrome c biogenesis protein CcmG/thiol:disulfide interchange protein DsbE
MKPWLKLAVLAVAAVVAARLLVHRPSPDFALGGPAPELALPDLAGRRVDLSGLKGRVVALNFWATWCGPCLLEIPELAEVWRQSRKEGRCFELLGVAEESGSREQVASEAERLAIPYPVLLDADGSVAETFRVPSYPRTYLIDAQGTVRRVFEGAVRRRTLEEALRPLLATAPSSCPRA